MNFHDRLMQGTVEKIEEGVITFRPPTSLAINAAKYIKNLESQLQRMASICDTLQMEVSKLSETNTTLALNNSNLLKENEQVHDMCKRLRQQVDEVRSGGDIPGAAAEPTSVGDAPAPQETSTSSN